MHELLRSPVLWWENPLFLKKRRFRHGLLGIGIELSGSDAEWWHDGGTWGTHAFAARLRDGWTWAAIFNSAPWDTIYTSSGGPSF